MFQWLATALRSTNILRRKPRTTIKNVENWAPFFAEVEASRRYTPDLPELERQVWHWFFIPDEMQVDHWQHHLLKDCEKVEEVGFTQSKYMMLKNDLGIFSRPLIFKDQLGYKNPPPMLPIKGELYKVPPKVFTVLDKDKQNTVFYFRQQISIVIPYTQLWVKDRSMIEKIIGKGLVRGVTLPEQGGKKVVRTGGTHQSSYISRPGVRRVWAWMYFADPSYWEEILNLSVSHPPVHHYTNPDGLVKEYYRFTDAEYSRNDKPPWEE